MVLWASVIILEGTKHFLSGAFVGLGAYCLMWSITRKVRYGVGRSPGSVSLSTASRFIGGLRWAAAWFALSLAHLLLDGML